MKWYSFFSGVWFDDLVIIAKVSHPIPSRTRTLNPLALMVLCLKTRESKSLPDLLTTYHFSYFLVYVCLLKKPADKQAFFVGKGWWFGDCVFTMCFVRDDRLNLICHALRERKRMKLGIFELIIRLAIFKLLVGFFLWHDLKPCIKNLLKRWLFRELRFNCVL